MAPQDGFVHDHRDIALPIEVHPRTRKGDPISGEKRHGEDSLPLEVEMDEEQRRDHITDGNGLERIGIRVERLPVEIQQVPLHDPPQQEQQEEAPEEFQVELSIRFDSIPVTGHRERDGHSGHEQEERHDEVPRRESFPCHMLTLACKPGGSIRIYVAQVVDYRPQEQQQEQICPAQDVQ